MAIRTWLLAAGVCLLLGCGGGEKGKNKDIDRPAPVPSRR